MITFEQLKDLADKKQKMARRYDMTLSEIQDVFDTTIRYATANSWQTTARDYAIHASDPENVIHPLIDWEQSNANIRNQARRILRRLPILISSSTGKYYEIIEEPILTSTGWKSGFTFNLRGVFNLERIIERFPINQLLILELAAATDMIVIHKKVLRKLWEKLSELEGRVSFLEGNQ